MGGEAGAGLRCGVGASIIDKRFDVDFDTVAESNKLQNSRNRTEGKKRSPVVLQSFHMVNVACIPKSIGGSCKRKGDCKEQAR